MATKKKLSGRIQPNITFETSGIDSSAVEDKLFGRSDHEAEEDDDNPAVFFCGKCKLPVGDSMSWEGSDAGPKQIRLKRVTNNVIVGKETRVLELSKRSVCLVVDLKCRSCHSVLGMVYTSTPRNLDYKRLGFFLNVASIDSYVLGSGGHMLAAGGPKEQPVTLEYRQSVEHQLSEMKMMVLTMSRRLEEIVAGLKEGCTKA
ncbi:PREDICTED: protein Mis18-alpha isoform X1 [Cyprinodon variegatus]|uniref:Protein Mis18-alpha n=1 Tax=Cyprinodon variegatus TaxID=28743 RepID=A0A3Q2EEE1_CYPVA|nr:PREDICTED: protein Mis18-alpha isoform X1 [Cyprinodon variegatus]